MKLLGKSWQHRRKTMKALLQALPVDLLQSMWPDLFTNNPALVRTMLHKECGRQLDQLKSQYEGRVCMLRIVTSTKQLGSCDISILVNVSTA
jgi:hypothetical protein